MEQIRKYSDWKLGKDWFWKFIVEQYEPKSLWEMLVNYFWTGEKLDYRILSLNPNITWEIVRDNPDKPWDYYCLSLNPNITMETVKNNPHRPWEVPLIKLREQKISELDHDNFKSWLYTSIIDKVNNDIDFQYIINASKKDWEWEHLSINPNITLEVFHKIKHMFPEDQVKIQGNYFLFDRVRYFRSKQNDLRLRQNMVEKVILPFSNYIKKVISKRLNYR